MAEVAQKRAPIYPIYIIEKETSSEPNKPSMMLGSKSKLFQGAKTIKEIVVEKRPLFLYIIWIYFHQQFEGRVFFVNLVGGFNPFERYAR